MNIQSEIDKINNMTHLELAQIWRHAPPGHPCMDKANGVFEHFEKRFKSMGGMTPEISEEVGW